MVAQTRVLELEGRYFRTYWWNRHEKVCKRESAWFWFETAGCIYWEENVVEWIIWSLTRWDPVRNLKVSPIGSWIQEPEAQRSLDRKQHLELFSACRWFTATRMGETQKKKVDERHAQCQGPQLAASTHRGTWQRKREEEGVIREEGVFHKAEVGYTSWILLRGQTNIMKAKVTLFCLEIGRSLVKYLRVGGRKRQQKNIEKFNFKET